MESGTGRMTIGSCNKRQSISSGFEVDFDIDFDIDYLAGLIASAEAVIDCIWNALSEAPDAVAAYAGACN